MAAKKIYKCRACGDVFEEDEFKEDTHPRDALYLAIGPCNGSYNLMTVHD